MSRWRVMAVIGVVIALNVLIFVAVAGLGPLGGTASVQAQDDSGKDTPIDFYPEPFANGAMAYSLRDPWDKTDLTYYFHNCPSRLPCQQGQDGVRQAFRNWEEVSALTFREVTSVADADIEVTWTSTDPQGVLGYPGDVLAYCYFPRYGGDMFIDDAEPWTIGDGSEFDLIITATHEIGHGIGLAHSEFTDAIMYAYAGHATQIGDDDISAVQALYGPPGTTTPTNPASENEDIDETQGNIPAVADEVDNVSGTINDTNPYDIWTLDIEPGVTVTITMDQTGGDLDPYVGILTEDLSAVLVENNDWLDLNARVVYTFENGGTYSVVATRYGVDNGLTNGTYELTVEFSRSGTGIPSAETPPTPQTITWRITNFAETELCQIYFSPSSDDTWGMDRTDGDPLENSFYYQWEVAPDTYDIQVWDCFGHKLEQYSISASSSIDVQIYQNRIQVVPLSDEIAASTTTTTSLIWRVSNYAGVNICKIFYDTSDQPIWGPNRIENDILEPGFYYQWELEPGTYDLRVEDCAGGYLEQYGVLLNSDTELAVFPSYIAPRPLR